MVHNDEIEQAQARAEADIERMQAQSRIHVRIFLNQTRTSMFRKYNAGDTLSLAFAGNFLLDLYQRPAVGVERDERVLNTVFRVFNIEHPEYYFNRSLSVADVVTLFDVDDKGEQAGIPTRPRTYVCAGFGWQSLDIAQTADGVAVGHLKEADNA